MRKSKPMSTTSPETPLLVVRKRDAALTDREREILSLFASGKTYVEAGDELGISPKTVGSYLQRVKEKLRAKNRSDLISYAIREGLLKG